MLLLTVVFQFLFLLSCKNHIFLNASNLDVVTYRTYKQKTQVNLWSRSGCELASQ